MKKLLTAFLLCLMSVFLAIGVSALNEYTPGQDGSFQVNFTGSPNADYAVFVIPGTYDESQYLARLRAMSPADFVYYDVQSANGVGTVTFSKIVPSRYVDSTVIISGGDLSQPILAGHFYPDGAKDEETVVVRVDKNKFLVAGRFGTQQKTQLETIKLDSFGFPSYTDTKVQYAITPETQDIYVDRDENLCVTPFSQEGVYELVASVGDNIDVAKITIEREPSKPYEIKVYDSQNEDANQIEEIWVDGVEGVFPSVSVHAKTFDQYGACFEDSFTYYIDGVVTGLPVKFSAVGEYTLKVASKENPEKFTELVVEVTDRPRYADGALALFEAIVKARGIDDSIGKKIFISDKNGLDLYPDVTWTTKANADKLTDALEKAKNVLSEFDKGNASLSDASSEATSLEKAINDFTRSLKQGVKVDIQSVVLDKSEAKLSLGQKLELALTVLPEKNTDTLTWYSDNEDVAKVVNGVVSAVGQGKTNICVRTSTGLEAVCQVEVFVPITKLSINPSKPTMALGGQPLQLIVNTIPETHSDKIFWSSENEDIASVDQNGLVTAYAAGSTKIVATTLSGKTAYVTLNVGLAADKIVVSTIKSTSVAVGKTLSISAKAAREDGRKPISTDVVYSIVSSTPEIPGKTVAAVAPELGKVGGMSPGTAIIRVSAATSVGEVYQDIEIKVCIPATKVTLNMTKAAMVVGGEDLQLSATMAPENNTDTLKWESADEEIATVDENGVVTAHKAGKVKITAISGSGKKATCTVSIGVPADMVEFTALKSTSLAVGKSLALKAKAFREDGQKPISADVFFEIIDGEEYATIDAKGKLVGISTGPVKVRATAQATLNDAHDEVVINVCVPATKVTLNMTKAAMVVGGDDLQLSATMAPVENTDTLSWQSSDEEIATVDEDGLVTALKPGKVKVTAISGSGKKATCTISIGEPADTVEFTALKSNTLAVGKSITLKAKASREDGQKPISTDVFFEIIDGEEYATIDAKGKLVGVSTGTVTVRAIAQATLNDASDEITIEIIVPVTSIKFAQSKLTVVVGQEDIVQEPAILPEINTDEITWSSSNEDVATVDENGFVTAHAKGTAKIYAKSKSGKSAYYTLNVTLAE